MACISVRVLIVTGMLGATNGCRSTGDQTYTQNLALGREYVTVPDPDYAATKDSGDAAQLTDGAHSWGRLWGAPTTVGWGSGSNVTVTMDLGKSHRVGGLAVSMGAGSGSGVFWPRAILVFTSIDDVEYRLATDMVVAKAGPQDSEASARHTYRASGLNVDGRFVRIVFVPKGKYTFVDEIEVLSSGSNDSPAGGSSYQVVENLDDYVRHYEIRAGVRDRVASDRSAVGKGDHDIASTNRVSGSVVPERVIHNDSFKSVFPINKEHREVFLERAANLRDRGLSNIVVWPAEKWDFLEPAAQPQGQLDELNLAMAQNEVRSVALNVVNLSGDSLCLSVEKGAGDSWPWIDVLYTVFTDTHQSMPVASALLPATSAADCAHEVSTPRGLPTQVWLRVNSRLQSAGRFQGVVRVGTGPDPIRLQIDVYETPLPDDLTLYLSGWDYSDSRYYAVTDNNVKSFVSTLREYGVDVPWAQPGAMPYGTFDNIGNLISPPDTTDFSSWLDRWPGSSRYAVFLRIGERFGPFQVGTAGFDTAVKNWIRWWVEWLESRGLTADSLVLLLLDEPRTAGDARLVGNYARLIRESAPEVQLLEDPLFKEPWLIDPSFFESVDIVVANVQQIKRSRPRVAKFYKAIPAREKELWLYSVNSRAKTADPYAAYRLQSWLCWELGATGSAFWSFGDTGGASSWNEYLSSDGGHTPLFIDNVSVATSKHMEAIREGAQDYEYLLLLRRAIAEASRGTRIHPEVVLAREFLGSAAQRVLEALDSAPVARWSTPVDRSVADSVRVEALRFLRSLNEIN